MIKNNYLLHVMLLIIIGNACSGPATKTGNTNDSAAMLTHPGVNKPDSQVAPPIAAGIHEKESDTLLTIIPAIALPVKDLEQQIKKDTQQVQIKITGLNKGHLVAGLRHSNPRANIRFNLVQLPDGTTDGPFGQSVQYPLKKKGDYMLIIGRSNMASGSPVGTVYISIAAE